MKESQVILSKRPVLWSNVIYLWLLHGGSENQMHLVRDCSKSKSVCYSLNRRENSSFVL
ncbi:hypothetical protein LguiA_030560 [Lonicera macranthoides]